MSMTHEQIRALRGMAKMVESELLPELEGAMHDTQEAVKAVNAALKKAADTIDTLSAKLSCSQMERSSQHYHGGWIPCNEMTPEVNEDGYSAKVLVNYENYTGMDICEYRVIDGVGDWYIGDSEERPRKVGVYVNAWRPLPARYEESGE